MVWFFVPLLFNICRFRIFCPRATSWCPQSVFQTTGGKKLPQLLLRLKITGLPLCVSLSSQDISTNTMFFPKRLVQYIVLIGFLLESVYLWNKNVELTSVSEQNPVHSSKEVFHENTIDSLESTKISPASACADIRPIVGIEPFPKFKLSANNVDGAGDMLQTYDWWDLWNGDSNCTRHQVHLLKKGSEPEPGAFVSFPGSGNSWIRSLLMGITGVYVTSVYTDEAIFFRPEGK